MKKTVTINIAGVAFITDEDAYSLLKSYFDDISGRLSRNEQAETMQDVENRVAEIFRSRGAVGIKVVSIELVREMILIIGSPSAFGGYDSGAGNPGAAVPPPYDPPLQKRFMRDRQHSVFGGVCSGAAAYLGMDSVLVRLIAFLLVFLGGLSIWVYIILWIVVPAAKTPQELEMMERMRNGLL